MIVLFQFWLCWHSFGYFTKIDWFIATYSLDLNAWFMSHTLLILKIYATFKDVQMLLKWFFDFSTGFRFQRSECSVHISSCPWLVLLARDGLKKKQEGGGRQRRRGRSAIKQTARAFFSHAGPIMETSSMLLLLPKAPRIPIMIWQIVWFSIYLHFRLGLLRSYFFSWNQHGIRDKDDMTSETKHHQAKGKCLFSHVGPIMETSLVLLLQRRPEFSLWFENFLFPVRTIAPTRSYFFLWNQHRIHKKDNNDDNDIVPLSKQQWTFFRILVQLWKLTSSMLPKLPKE